MSFALIIPSGGSGQRFGTKIPKQYALINNIPIIVHACLLFSKIQEIELLVVPIHKDWQGFVDENLKKVSFDKPFRFVPNGKERQHSVYNALQLPEIQKHDFVLIHDAVRPYATASLASRVIEATVQFNAAIPALTPKETIKTLDENGCVNNTPNRSKLASVQTPQGFATKLIIEAYDNAFKLNKTGTDDASFVEMLGEKVKVIPGEEKNVKITTPEDIRPEWL